MHGQLIAIQDVKDQVQDVRDVLTRHNVTGKVGGEVRQIRACPFGNCGLKAPTQPYKECTKRHGN